MLPKPSKEVAIRFIKYCLPEYGDILSRIEKNRGWLIFEPWYYKALENLKITDYAKFYPDESIIPNLFVLAFIENLDDFIKLSTELKQACADQQTEFLDNWIVCLEQEDEEALWNFEFPETPEEQAEALRQWESLSEEERTDICKRTACFMAFFMLNFHNYFAIMVHGRSVTKLVQAALQGDDEAFVLAAQIDPTVMSSIPYFKERETLAYREGDSSFLEKLAYRRKIPLLQGRIRFRLLYFLFAMLEGMNLLDDLTHREILDICDAVGLDRWQNRIEDVNYLTKRLREYRRFQNHKFTQ